MEKIITMIKNKWQTIFLVTLMTVAVVFSISAFITPRYSSEVSMIVIQKQPSYDVDAFSAAKSAEYLSEILSKVIYTNSFLNDVLAAPYEVKRAFSEFPEKRKKQWERTIKVDKENNTGIIHVTVFDVSRNEAEKLAQSIAWSFSVRNHKYHGGGDRVKVELIDGPITSAKPSNPDLLVNSLLALIIGLIGSLVLIFYFENFNLKFFQFKKNGNTFNWLGEKIKKQFEGDFPVEAGEDYRIEKKNEKKETDKNIKASIHEEIRGDFMISKKSSAPDNLPIFMGEQDSGELIKKGRNDFINLEDLEENKVIDKKEKIGEDNEPSEEEVKERLNKLLKGNL